MSEAERLAEALKGLFVRPDHGWFTSIPVAVADLTAEQATKVPAPRFNNVWAVVNHVWFWQQVMLLRLRGEPAERKALGAEDGWPPAGDPTDDQAWRGHRTSDGRE